MNLKEIFLKQLLVYQIIHQIIIPLFIALGKGVSIIEKHYTDTYQRKGVDIDASIDFKKLRDLIEGSIKIFQSLPGRKKNQLKKKKSTMKFAFASVVSIKDIKKNEKFSLKNIWVKRPGNGDFLAERLQYVIGKKAKQNIKKKFTNKKKVY